MTTIGPDDRKPAQVLLYPAQDQEAGHEFVAAKLEAILLQDPKNLSSISGLA
jgi:hypothetical protein